MTKEKVLLNIDKIQKMINPNSKKQIVVLEENGIFKGLIDSMKKYIDDYPDGEEFPKDVYDAIYQLVEYSTNQFDENTSQIKELISQRETNIDLATKMKNTIEIIQKGEDWEKKFSDWEDKLSEDVKESFHKISKSEVSAIDALVSDGTNSEDYQGALKILTSKINNLESNLHIEIDLERMEDRSKALSYMGIELSESLKYIVDSIEELEESVNQIENAVTEEFSPTYDNEAIDEEAIFEVKPTFWQKLKETKIGRALRFVFGIRIVITLPALPALPEGRGE